MIAPIVSPPPDFSLVYHWVSGTVPPPNHYEYTVTVGPGEEATLQFLPDYPAPDTPVWSERLAVTYERISWLYSLVTGQNLLRKSWQTERDNSIGGSLQFVTIVADGKRYSIPQHLGRADRTSMSLLHDAVRAIVPRETWDRLNARRDRYMEEYRATYGG